MKTGTGSASIYIGFFLSIFIGAVFHPMLYASDLSDATMLRDKCETNLKVLEVPVRNFGDSADIDSFQKAGNLVKLGKMKLLQTKYLEAIKIYKEYLLLEKDIYMSLAKKYLARTQKMSDDIAVDLVDHIDKTNVEKYIRLANQNLKDAGREISAERYQNCIKLCRVSKKYSLSAYAAAGVKEPSQYKVDFADNENRILNK
ncbi:MAG: hypothetical protein JXA07_00105 [Spirochaetes bacterium]|nr:hypothetical protein [Spirochaetota bacterium]